jgi:acyl-CoA thioester hydrolase
MCGCGRPTSAGYEIGALVRSFDDDSVHYELGIFLDGTCLGVADAVGPRGALPAEYLRNP